MGLIRYDSGLAGEIKSLMLPGPAGRLEALLNVGEPDATHAAVVCHPHPLYGGTMHNKVVYHCMKALTRFGFHVLRFNFRGTGLSEGTHDEGRGEREDVKAAIDYLQQEFGLPIIFAGFSFGAATGMKALCPDPRIVGMISLGTPVAAEGRHYRYDFLRECVKPKLFISGSNDQYSPRAVLEEVFARAAEPKKLVIVEGAEHFFVGKLDQMQAAVESWITSLYKPAAAETEQT
jgi:alpha/beta superfamily hydrolase